MGEVRTVAIVQLAKAVSASFAANGITANVTTVGWRLRNQQLNQGPGGANRVSFMPGRKPSGESADGGNLTRDARGYTNPRPIVAWHKEVTMSVWAADPSNTEEANLIALELLLEQAITAVHAAADPDTGIALGGGNIEWGSVEYTVPPAEGGFGKEALVSFVQKTAILDRTIDVATPQAVLTRSLEASS